LHNDLEVIFASILLETLKRYLHPGIDVLIAQTWSKEALNLRTALWKVLQALSC
jgi:hypothetical protein